MPCCAPASTTTSTGRARRSSSCSASFVRRARAVRRLGSAALDLCYVAAGRFDGFWEDRLKPWDVAAGALIVEEAGGLVTNLAGEPFDVRTGQLVTANAALHPQLLEVIRLHRAGGR